jgi:transposase InsO family protein
MAAPAAPTAQQLLEIIAQQQLQITQFLTLQQGQQSETIPSLPDIPIFEPSDEKSRITEWTTRFKFGIDCAAPHAADEIKVKALMNKLSENAFSEYSKHCLPDEVTDFNFDESIKKLEALFAKPQSIFVDRYECLIATRSEGEDFRQFINRHKKLLSNFQFEKLKEEQFKCLMLLTSLKSPNDVVLRQRILTKLTADGDDIKYDKVIEDLINFMATIAEAKIVERSSNKPINAIKKFKPKQNEAKQDKSKGNGNAPCWRCGKNNHRPDDCRFKGAKCNKCQFPGHIEAQCAKVQEWRNKNKKNGPKKNIGTIRIGTTLKQINSTKLLKMEVKLNNKPVIFHLDCGAEVNIIDEDTYDAIGRPAMKKCFEKGIVYDGTECSFIGKGKCTFEFNQFKVEHDLYVAPKGSINLLGIETMDSFGLLDELKNKINVSKINNLKCQSSQNQVHQFIEKLKKEFCDVFSKELGHCTKIQAKLTLKDGVQPIYRKARPVPYNAKEIVEKELDRLEAIGVIKKVEHTDWAAPILTVEKADGSTRLCIDYSTGLNNALVDNQHPLPLPEDIFATLNGGKIFSQIDLRDAYFQVELEENSKKICAIATHKGNFVLNRLPFGVKTAPGIFQSIMDKMLDGLGYAAAYLDDIIVVSKTMAEHQKHLEEIFNRIRAWGFKVKLEKCAFFKDQISYLGQIIDKEGRRPDPKKIHAIKNMPPPSDVPSLRSYLGMVNHYQQFVKNMRFIRKPLDDLLKKESEWKWDENCQNAFKRIKEILTSDLLLTHYDPTLEIIVSADASEKGIGAVISHKFSDGKIKAIAHASSALSPAEKNYSQIEKEGLALIFAVEKFHKMIYGRKFILQTDHKPLLAIFGNKKGIKQCSANRLLRWSLILLGYDFSIEYVNTVEFGQADALSRLIAKNVEKDDRVIASVNVEAEIEGKLIANIEKLPIQFKNIADATKNDQDIQKVMKFIQNGWPNDKALKNETNNAIKIFIQRKEHLSITKGCLMYADRIVIPKILQLKILKTFHKGHPGMKRMKQLMRNYVYWPMMDNQIEDYVKNCEPCQMAAKMPIKTDLHPWPKASKPWERVHLDYAGPFFGKEYLIIVDAYSKYPEIFEMPTKSAAATIEKMRYLCSRHGLPEILVSDNGTQFTSNEFARFTEINGITHYFSAPYNPMSNGQAERFVDTFKRTFRKLKGEGVVDKEIIETFLITYRNTPNDSLDNGKSPAEAFLGRKVRTTLDLLRPTSLKPLETDEEMKGRFNKRFGTKMRTFSIGNKVYARHRISQSWRPGIVTKCTGVIYDIAFQDGSTGRFHANQIRPRFTPNENENPLNIFLEAFELPKAPEIVEEPPIIEEVNEPEENEELEPPEQIVQPPAMVENRRNPVRNRRAPNRFTPSP